LWVRKYAKIILNKSFDAKPLQLPGRDHNKVKIKQ